MVLFPISQSSTPRQGSGQSSQVGVVLVPFCLELGRHILKMIERDPRRPTLSAVVLLGFQSKANHVDRQKKITNLALVIAKNRRQVTRRIALKTNKFRSHGCPSFV